MKKIVVTLDSTQISSFLECPRLWDYGDRQHLTLKVQEPNNAMMIGSYGHKLLEIYYKGRAAHLSGADAIQKAKAFDPDTESCECGHEQSKHIIIGGTPFCHKGCSCKTFTPKPYPLPKDIRADVARRFELHCYTYANRDFIVTDERAVEVGFSHRLYESSTRLYILEGRIDLFNPKDPEMNTIGFVDHKFQMQRRDLYEKSVQFRNYAYVTKARLAIINYIRMAKNIDGNTFQRKLISFSPMEHLWWEKELLKIYNAIAGYIVGEAFPPNWNSCQGRFNTRCAFTSLCEEINSDIVEAKKEQLYVLKEQWRPW